MAKKTDIKDVAVLIKMDKSLHASLTKDAKADGRPLSAYIRHMLATDPRRAKKN